jgi:Tfp pilus assembly protein PilF
LAAREPHLDLIEEALRAHMEGDFARAVELFSQSIALKSTAEAFTYRGWGRSFLGDIDGAIEDCKCAIDVDPDFGNPYNDIGSYLMRKGQVDEAIDWLERAKSAPRYEPRHFPYLNLGRIFLTKGLMRRALDEFEAALKIDPHDPTALEAVTNIKSKIN